MRRILATRFVLLVLLLLGAIPAVAQAQPIERIDARTGDSRLALSADGRYVAFASDAADLVLGDTNGEYDVFVYDREAKLVSRVSVASDGGQADGGSLGPSISADGRYVAFSSAAADLVPDDTNGWEDVFVHDRETGATERVSIGNDGAEADFISFDCSLSGDGRYVAFSSGATNLVAEDLNGHWDVFVRDRAAGTTEIVSLAGDGSQADGGSFSGCSVSADGRYVAFVSAAGNLVADDTSLSWDVFVRDRSTGTTDRVSLVTGGDDVDAGCQISADGTCVAFSWGSRIYVFDRSTGTVERVDVSSAGAGADDASTAFALSADGRYVAFTSWAGNLTTGDTNEASDVFVHDRAAGTTERVSLAAEGAQGDSFCEGAALSADGLTVAFVSLSSDLVPGDSEGTPDVFVMTRFFASLRGTDRYDTAIKISRAFYPRALPADSGVVLAPGETFQQALCGAPLAAAYGGPVLLTPTVGLNNAVRAEIARLAPTHVVCIDLPAAVVDAVQAELGPATSITSIKGGSVYETSYLVAKALEARVGKGMIDTALLTPGDRFPDAIGVSPLAAHERWPILLTPSGTDALSGQAIAAMSELGVTWVVKIGTYAVLPPAFTGLANLSGKDRYQTNINVAEWEKQYGDLSFAHLGLATGDKFPDALTAGPALATLGGILLITPLTSLDPRIAGEITVHKAEVLRFYHIAMIEPVLGQVRALLP